MVSARLLLTVVAAAGLVSAQDARPQFEVASIKPNAGGGRGSMFGSRGPGTFNTENIPVRMMIAEAYGVKQFQISGGPAWMNSDGYDITAKPGFSEGRTMDERREKTMLRLQGLLEDRFQLKFHLDTKEMPVYFLTVAKNGLKLPEANCIKYDIDHPPARPAAGQPPPRYCGNMRGGRNGPNMVLDAMGITMTDLIRWLSMTTSRTVIDKTGYTGSFDASVEYAPDMGQPPPGMGGGESATPAVTDNTAASLFSALQERLGLKLEAGKGPVEILVIDRVERPTEN